MKITFGMPEILVLFSAFIYNYSLFFSITAFVLGIMGRLCAFSIEYQKHTENLSANKELMESLKSSFNDLLSTSGINWKTDKKSTEFH